MKVSAMFAVMMMKCPTVDREDMNKVFSGIQLLEEKQSVSGDAELPPSGKLYTVRQLEFMMSVAKARATIKRYCDE